MLRLQSTDDFTNFISQPQPTVVVYRATWCMDCHYIDSFMTEVEQKYADRLQLAQLDRDDFADLCEKYYITGIPSFIAFRGGEELIRYVNKLRKSREGIEKFLDRVVAVSNALA